MTTPDINTAVNDLLEALEKGASWSIKNNPAIVAALEQVRKAQQTPAPVVIDNARVVEALEDILGAVKKARTVRAPASHYDEDVYYNGIDIAPQLDIAGEILEQVKGTPETLAPVVIDAVATDPEPEPEPFKVTTFELGKNGKLVESKSTFDNLEPGRVITWGGNRAWSETHYCIISRRPGSWGVSYQCYNLDDPEDNSSLHHVEARSIKSREDESVWHSQHFFLEDQVIDPELVETYKADHLKRAAALQQHIAEETAADDKLEALGRKLWPELIGECPAVIVAELEENDSDVQTDYHASHTVKTVILAPSKHTRNNFQEFRKAAELLEETQHLGRGKGRFSPYVKIDIDQDFISNGSCYYAGQHSPWHRELDHDDRGNSVEFHTREEAEAHIAAKGEPYDIKVGDQVITFAWDISEDKIENRENYTGGAGYYLGYHRYSGWKVAKKVFYKSGQPQRGDYINLAKRHDHLKK